MFPCPHPDCGWHAVAPSRRAALSRLAEHVVAEHGTVVDADVPEGMVQVKQDGEWTTLTPEEAKARQRDHGREGRR